jgi:hypothetical protein
MAGDQKMKMKMMMMKLKKTSKSKQTSKLRQKIASGESGQSTVEFALTLIMLMGFVMFYLQLSMVMAFGNYVHYATFMSARAYLSSGPDQPDQARRAQEVIVRMLKKSTSQSSVDRLPSIAKGVGGGDIAGYESAPPSQFSETNPDSSWMQGVRYTFKSRLFMIPMGGSGSGGPNATNSVTLKSESWLGREPSYEDCIVEITRMKGLIDNGC